MTVSPPATGPSNGNVRRRRASDLSSAPDFNDRIGKVLNLGDEAHSARAAR
jgi:hypothetical protein